VGRCLKRLIAERIRLRNYINLRAEGIFLRLLNFSENPVRIKREKPALRLTGFDVPRSYYYGTCTAIKKSKVLLAGCVGAPAV
jgi:hypothetical protein